MDDIDRKIIGILQGDARISVTDLADEVSLSISATGERLRRLRSSDVISRFSVDIDPVAVGRPIQALVDVRLPPGASYSGGAEETMVGLAAVVDAVHLTGSFDAQLRVAARDVGELDDLLAHLKDVVGVLETNTRLILRTIDGFPRSPAV